jgi:antitoxin component YwqK of YwqJK toxin-antitoxin module
MMRKFVNVIGNFMKTLLTILLFVGLYNSSLGCCADDDRTLTEMLFQGKTGTIFTCKILTFSTLTDQYNNILTSSVGIDGKATAEIVTVYFGKVDTNVVTLRAGSYLSVGKTYLIYTEGSGQVYGFGGTCDRWSKEITENFTTTIELQTLKQFSDIFRNKSSGQFTFTNSKNIVIAQGQFKEGLAIKIWKHFYDNGIIKAQFDLTNNITSQYSDNGFIKTRITVNGNIEYYEKFSDKVSGQLTFTDKEVKNDTCLVMTVTEYYKNGNIKKLSSQLNINSKGGSSYSSGKTGDYKEFHENGNLKLQGQFNTNKRIELWKWYHENGEFYTEFDYKDGTGGQ